MIPIAGINKQIQCDQRELALMEWNLLVPLQNCMGASGCRFKSSCLDQMLEFFYNLLYRA